MAPTMTKNIRRWATWLIATVFVISLLVWFLGRDPLPKTIHIAAGEENGLYYQLGDALRSSISERTSCRVDVESTEGSIENLERLVSGRAHLGVVQGGSVPMDDVSVVTPLFPELVLIIIRKGSGIESIADLDGRNVSLGPERSGNRHSALRVLNHFGIDVARSEPVKKLHFKHLLDDSATLDAAIVTAGIGHGDLAEVLRTNEFELLPIADVQAVDMVHPYLRSTEVPRGLFAALPPVPSANIPTISTTAYLVARNDAPDSLVSAALAGVHEENLRLKIPTLIPRGEAASRVPTRFHPIAQRYFNPSDNVGYMANVMESLAATKELLFAIGAGIYLLWLRWRALKTKEAQEVVSRHKEHLDLLLEETLRIEENQMRSTDTDELQMLLNEVTRIKLRALQEFTDEELRGDQAFSIFLMQCANLINKIQLKIITQGSAPSDT